MVEDKKKNKSKFSKTLKDTIVNILIIILGFALALGIFVAYKNNERQKEINSYIPNGKVAYDSGEYSTSITLFTNAEKEFPNNIEVKRYLGKLYFLKGDYNNSKVYYEKLKTASQLNDEDISNLGNSYIKLGNDTELFALWKDKILKAEDSYKLAGIYLKNKDYDNYFLELGKIKEYKEPIVYSQVRETSLPTIITNLDSAVTAKSVSDEVLDFDLFRNQMVEAKKQLDANKKDFSELIQLAAFSNINQCDLITSRIKSLRSSLESQKIPSYQVDYLEGKCANQAGSPDVALPLIGKAIAADTTNLEYREELAKSHFLKKDIENLKKVYAEIFVIKKSPTLVSNYSAYLYKLDSKKDAVDNYREAAKLAEDGIQKQNIVETIFQIEFLDFKSLDICKTSELVEVLELSDPDQYFLRGHCEIFLKGSIPDPSQSNLESDYLKALAKKDRVGLEKVMDKDVDGTITSYYNAVGKLLIQ